MLAGRGRWWRCLRTSALRPGRTGLAVRGQTSGTPVRGRPTREPAARRRPPGRPAEPLPGRGRGSSSRQHHVGQLVDPVHVRLTGGKRAVHAALEQPRALGQRPALAGRGPQAADERPVAPARNRTPALAAADLCEQCRVENAQSLAGVGGGQACEPRCGPGRSSGRSPRLVPAQPGPARPRPRTIRTTSHTSSTTIAARIA